MGVRIYTHVIFLIFAYIIVEASCKGTLTFVIDDTTSMYQEINQVRESVYKIKNIVLHEKSSLIENMALITFNDPGANVSTLTKDPDEFKKALDAIYLHNDIEPNDCEEMAMKGLLLALEKSNPNSFIYVFTDASAKDYTDGKYVIDMCQKKQTQIVFVLTDLCYSYDDVDFQIYAEIARACTGHMFFVTRSQVKQVFVPIEETLKGNKTVITTATIPAYNTKDIQFTIDDQTDYALVSTFGREVYLKIAGPLFTQENLMSTIDSKVIKLSNVTPGTYTATVWGKSKTTIIVVGRTDFFFSHGFSELVPKTLGDTSPQPIAGTKTYLSISVTDKHQSVTIESAQILGIDEKPIKERQPLKRISKDFYVTEPFNAPSQKFKVAVHGIVKATGIPITRIAKMPITPPEPPPKLPDKMKPVPHIEEGRKIDVDYNSTVKLTCKVMAYPEPKIMWLNSTGAIMPSQSSLQEYPYKYISYMEISPAVKEETYVCFATNGEGKTVASIKVSVNDPFTVKSAPQATTKVVYGSEGTIKCNIRSHLPMVISWYYANDNTGKSGQIEPSDKYLMSADYTELKIRKMDMDLVGRYSCNFYLKNDKEVQRQYSTQVVIDGLVAPKIQGPTQTKAVKGKTAIFNCKIVSGVPAPKITWLFGGKSGSKFTPVDGSGSVLNIKSVTEKDAGKYKCVAENAVSKVEHITTLFVQDAPRISTTTSTIYQATEGDVSLKVPCVASGVPKPVITWILNGRVITPNAKYSIEDGTLIIRDPKVSDANSYTCKATNEVTAVTATFRTYIRQAPQISGSPIQKVRIGTPANIECSIMKGEPKPKIAWQYMDIVGTKYVPIRGSETTLRIPVTNTKHAGRYKCVAHNEVGTSEHVTTLEVQDLPKITSDTSILYQSTEGDASLKIPCITSGLPRPTITWKLNGHAITSNAKYFIKDGTLTIKDPKVSDTNSYTCEATNEVGLVSATFRTYIRQSPQITGVADVKVRIGTPASIECRVVKGVPQPKITWQFMETVSSRFVSIYGSENVLHIAKAENKNAGRYKCLAQNDVGSAEYVTTLIVESPPQIIVKSSTVEGIEGDLALRIPCNVVGIPRPVVTWKLKGATITSNTKYSIEDGALVIMKPKKEDTSAYTCEANNYLGAVNATFKATVDKGLNNFGTEHDVYLLRGQSSKIKCDPYSSNSQSIKWFLNYDEKNTTEPYIQIEKATLSDTGNYTCHVSDIHGNVQTHTYHVYVGNAPEFEPMNSLDDWQGDVTAILTNCDHTGSPEPDTEWTYNGKVINDEEVGISYKWGHYACNVSNVHGSVLRSFDVQSTVCLISRNLKETQHMPLILSGEGSWPEWTTTLDYAVVETEEQITLSCPSQNEKPNSFKNFPTQSVIKANCKKEDIFIVNGKDYKLSELQCSISIEPTIVRKKVVCSKDSELIRVGYNVGGFLEIYEVCFNVAKNLPVYTRIIMGSTDSPKSNPYNWHTYPGIGDRRTEGGYSCKGKQSSCCYDKTQLVNAKDFNNDVAQNSLFIDPLNAVPVWRHCDSNHTTWEEIDTMVRSQLVVYDNIIVWSGTHTMQEKGGAVIPRYLWKVLRFDHEQAMAIVYINDPSPTKEDIKCKDICASEKSWLNVKGLGTYCCSLTDFLKAFDFHDSDIGDSWGVVRDKIEKSA